MLFIHAIFYYPTQTTQPRSRGSSVAVPFLAITLYYWRHFPYVANSKFGQH